MFKNLNLRRTASAISTGLLISLSAQAEETHFGVTANKANVTQNALETTTVEFGPYKVQVPKGG